MEILTGKWHGTGHARYPSIEPQTYSDSVEFKVNGFDNVIFYEERAVIEKDGARKGEPIFWESGFIKFDENNGFTLSCSQKTGRIELYKGLAEIREDILSINFSLVMTNDSRLRNVVRKWDIYPNKMNQFLDMEFSDTKLLTNHLNASYKKQI